MRHLILSRELPPAVYPAGGIGTYVANIARLLAEAGETVHVIAERWEGAPEERTVACNGRLVVHRVPADAPGSYGGRRSTVEEIDVLRASNLPAQAWVWNATLLAESLVETAEIEVIEAQEWEAPLYFVLLRRALGLGPPHRPACIVHLHSPSELIFRYNEWSIGRPDYLPLRRNEDFCIAAADALVCPSRYLARQCEAHYGLAAGDVHVIPLPMGAFQPLARPTNDARDGAILYVGRLEPRKGLVEWVAAAVPVARDTPGLRFEFLGADVPYKEGISVETHVRGLIPSDVEKSFVFRGAVSRDQLAKALAEASFAVIPSRWENFPNTCLEAMSAGVPVLVSPNGGMAEMVEDGVTGWIAPSQMPADLERTLRRALRSTPTERASMGRAATVAIRELCEDARIVAEHIAFRGRVARLGATRSNDLPANFPMATPPVHPPRRLRARVGAAHDGAVVPLGPAPGESPASMALRSATTTDHEGFLLVAAGFAARAETVRIAGDILDRVPDVGIVGGWLRDAGDQSISGCPSFPYQWLWNDADAVFVVRSSALADLSDTADVLASAHPTWALVNAVLAAGWKAVTVPAIIGSRTADASHGAGERAGDGAAEMHRSFAARYPDLLAHDAEYIAALRAAGLGPRIRVLAPSSDPEPRITEQPVVVSPKDVLRLPLRSKLELASRAIREPSRALAWIRYHVRRLRGR